MDNERISTMQQALEAIGIKTQENGECRIFDDVMSDLKEKWYNLTHIDNLLNQVEMIGLLYLSGGEPTLNIDAIQYVYEAIRKRNIPLF